jgi:hypothetical protein
MTRRFLPLLALSVALLAAPPAFASLPTCPTDAQTQRLEAFRDRVAAAPTTEAAQELALEQTKLGRLAIHRAHRVLPGNADIAEVESRFDAFEAGVYEARSPAQVADRFDLLIDTRSAQCDYTTTEIVVIVIGFLLGILPGILFLFLFC